LDATAGARIASIWDGLFADQRAAFHQAFSARRDQFKCLAARDSYMNA